MRWSTIICPMFSSRTHLQNGWLARKWQSRRFGSKFLTSQGFTNRDGRKVVARQSKRGKTVSESLSKVNYNRVIETWWDEYKEYYYQRHPKYRPGLMEFIWMTHLNDSYTWVNILYDLTLIRRFLGPSPSVFSGKKIQIHDWWRHSWDLANKNYMYR